MSKLWPGDRRETLRGYSLDAVLHRLSGTDRRSLSDMSTHEEIILRILAGAQEPLHPYEIAKRLNRELRLVYAYRTDRHFGACPAVALRHQFAVHGLSRKREKGTGKLKLGPSC